jgi:hypothetical protein
MTDSGPWDSFSPSVAATGPWDSYTGPNVAEKSPAYSPMNPNEPGLQDVSIPDAMAVQGIGGLAKAGLGMATRGVGAGLEALPLTKNIVPTVENTANDMLLKGLGTRGLQIKGMGGLEKARDAADVAREAGMDKVFSTEIGRREALQNLIETHGEEIGAQRLEPGTASPNMLEQVGQDVTAKYNPALKDPLSAQLPNVEKSINMIKNTAGPVPTHAGIAQGITDLNKFATGAKQLQPINAYTDVAHAASAANDAEMAQKMGSEWAAKYLKNLHNESGGFKLTQPFERGAERAAVGSGQGQSSLMAILQRIKDAGGYRAASKGLNALHEGLAGPIDLSTLPPNALKAYLANKAEEEK